MSYNVFRNPKGRLPSFPKRYPGILKDIPFLEQRRKELEHYFSNLPSCLYLHPIVKEFLEIEKNLKQQGFDMDLLPKTEDESQLRMQTTFDFSSCVPWLQAQLTTNKFLFLLFYRGCWCPYSKPHIQTSSAVIPDIRLAGGDIFGICGQANGDTEAFAVELKRQIDLVSDPSMSLALLFHLFILKTTHPSHPLQLINQPAVVVVRRRSDPEDSAIFSSCANLSLEFDTSARKKLVQEENLDLEILHYGTSASNSPQNVADIWNCVVKQKLAGKKPRPNEIGSASVFSYDFWKMKDYVITESQTETTFTNEDEIRLHIQSLCFSGDPTSSPPTSGESPLKIL